MADVNVLEVEIARKTYASAVHRSGEILVLEDLRFAVPSGQFTCLLGPSGSGKTTLLQLISGLDLNVEGSIRVAGHPPGEGPLLGYMFQSPRLLPWLTVLENVRLVAGSASLEKGLPEALLERMELSAFLGAFPNRLSGGMQRRVALARAFVNEPPLLLLDEPFISLDAPVASRLREVLLSLWREREATIVFVTHDLREAIHLADRILFFSSGPARLVLDHTVDLPRPRADEGQAIELYRHELLSRHPALLAGIREMESQSEMGTDVPANARAG